MAVSPEHEQYIVGQLEAAGRVRSKRMFGSVGLYLDGAFCGIIGADWALEARAVATGRKAAPKRKRR